MDFDLVYLSLGSNIGDKMHNIESAIVQISLMVGPPVIESSLYETEPWGNTNQEAFLNQVIAIKTNYEPKQLLEKLLNIEIGLGRIRTKPYAPRIIDLDILLFKNKISHHKEIIIPHPRMHLRKFVLEPMTEIRPNLIHPLINLSMKELLQNCEDKSLVKKCSPHEIKS